MLENNEVYTKIFNALFSEYEMGKIYVKWRDNSDMSKYDIVFDKCSYCLPKSLISSWRALCTAMLENGLFKEHR